MKEWTEIKISVNAADIDRAGDIANVVVPCGIYIEDYTNLEQIVTPHFSTFPCEMGL